MRKQIISVIVIFTLLLTNNIYSQTFSGFKSFERIIEFEGQRYLMEEKFEITSNEIDRLKIDMIIKEIDSNEGFMFVLTSYSFNDTMGIVVSAFNATNFEKTSHNFTNLHLTDKEFRELNDLLVSFNNNVADRDLHYLKRFNDRIIVDVKIVGGGPVYSIWIDGHSRHSLSDSQWYVAFERYEKFAKR